MIRKIIVLFVMFLIVGVGSAFAQDPTPSDTPSDTPAETPVIVEPPTEAPTNADPYAIAYEALGLFFVALLAGGKLLQQTVEKFVKPALDNSGIKNVKYGSRIYWVLLHGSALAIGIVTALAGKTNLFVDLPYAFFSGWSDTALYIASGVALGFAAFGVHDLGRLLSAWWNKPATTTIIENGTTTGVAAPNTFTSVPNFPVG